MPHGTVLNYALSALEQSGYEVEKMSLGLARDSNRFFGTLTLNSRLASGVSLAVGIRSSLDKSISLQWCCGSRVFVCDNLAFSSQKTISRKHTTKGVERYQEAIFRAVGELESHRDNEALRIRKMQTTSLPDTEAESLLLRSYYLEKILSARTLDTAIQEWRFPSHEDFEEKTLWRLFNAITTALQPSVKANPQRHASATIRPGALLSPEDDGAAVLPTAT